MAEVPRLVYPDRHYLVGVAGWTLDDLPFEACALGQFLTARAGVRPSGITQLVDEQLAVEARLPLDRVRHYVELLSGQRRVVRDGVWLWTVETFAHYPKSRACLTAAERDIRACGSVAILMGWTARYPLQRRWAEERLAEIRPKPASDPASKPPGVAPASRASFRGEPQRAGSVLAGELERLRREAGSA